MTLIIDQVPTIVTGTSFSLQTSAFTTVNSQEIVVVMAASDGFFGGNGASFSISDTNSNSYTLVQRENVKKGTVDVWYVLANSIQTNLQVTATIDSNNVGDHASIQIITLSGHNASNPIGAIGNFAISASAVNKSINTTMANSYVFAAFGEDANFASNTNAVVGTGQTKISEGNQAANAGEQIYWRTTNPVASIGSQTMNLTTPSTDTGNLVIFEIIPAIQPLGMSISNDFIQVKYRIDGY